MRPARALPALLCALGALCLIAPASTAQEPAQGASPAQAGAAEPHAEAPRGAAPRRRGSGAGRTPEQWWTHAREVLLEGVTLSDEQSRQVDEIVGAQVAARRRARDLQDELRRARRRKDVERTATLRAQLRANRGDMKDPATRIEEIREILDEPQRPTFDMNRARLVAESQQAREARLQRAPKQADRAGKSPVEAEDGLESEPRTEPE